jgi:hypothetical protein
VTKAGALCGYCNPDSGLVRRRRSFEHRVVRVLHAAFPDIPLRANKVSAPASASAGDRCMRFRPDAVLDFATHFVVVEVDEHQHDTYDKTCEWARMVQVQDQLGLPCVFVRFNPHRWTTRSGSQGRASFPIRLKALVQAVARLGRFSVPNARLSVFWMYYNERSTRTL